MKRKAFKKFVTDWAWYEHTLSQLEEIGFNLTPDHPLWKMSDNYCELVAKKFDVSEELLRETMEPVFMGAPEDVEELIVNNMEETGILDGEDS